MDSKAIRPSFLNVPSLIKDKAAERKGASNEERSLFHMAQTGGWQLFEGYAEQLMKELDEINTLAISNGEPLEEIGKNAIVISLTKDVITRLLNKVGDAKESCETGEE